MGGLGGGGGGKSYNKAYDQLKGTYSPMTQQGVAGFSALGNLLGVNGSGAHSQALDDYWNSSGGKFQLEQGMDALDSKFAGLGLSRSGAAMKGMEQFRQDLASSKLDSFLGRLMGFSQLGLGAGNLIANAGQYSKGASQGGGLGAALGSFAGALAMSDRRAKIHIERIGDWDDRGDGLGKYRYAYKWAPNEMLIGVMADEVKELRPAAFIPNFARGYDGVNYARLGDA